MLSAEDRLLCSVKVLGSSCTEALANAAFFFLHEYSAHGIGNSKKKEMVNSAQGMLRVILLIFGLFFLIFGVDNSNLLMTT